MMQELFKKRTNIYIGLGVGILGILTLFFWHSFFNHKAIADNTPLVRTIVVGAESGRACRGKKPAAGSGSYFLPREKQPIPGLSAGRMNWQKKVTRYSWSPVTMPNK